MTAAARLTITLSFLGILSVLYVSTRVTDALSAALKATIRALVTKATGEREKTVNGTGAKGLQIIPERAKVLSFNNKYVSNLSFYVKRHHRRGNYYINLEGVTHHVWINNITAHLIFYEYLHNEYKRSFVEMHFKFCDMVKNDPYIGKAVVAAGISCPMLPGTKKFQNISIPANEFPHVWPFERCKVDIKVHQTTTEEPIFNLEIYAMFKQKTHT